MKESLPSPERSLASFLHKNRETLVQGTVRAFFEASRAEFPPTLRELHLEAFLREKLAALEFDLVSGSMDHIRRHLRKSAQRAAFRALSLASRLRLNLHLKRVILDRLSLAYGSQSPELAAMRLIVGRLFDEMLLELGRSLRKKRQAEGEEEPIMDALFEAKRGLASEQELLRTLIDQSPQAIVALDSERHIMTWNPAAEAIMGYEGDEILGQSFGRLLEPPKTLAAILKDVRSHGPVHNLEVAARRKGGEIIPISLSVTALPKREGLTARFLCIFGDLTEQVKAREQAIAAEKLSALARLSTAVAHEIRNPLNTLSLTIDVLEEILSGTKDLAWDEVTPRLEVLRGEVELMSEITNTYLTLARLPTPRVELQNLTTILRSFSAQVRPDLQFQGITLEEDLVDDLPLVPVDERQIRRVLHNLFRNAREAMPEGGRLRLATRVVDGAVELKLTDTGPGIPEAFRERLFAPFQTTKEGGTGLGLYLVREILRAHGGTVSVESQPAGGTTVVVQLPTYGEEEAYQAS